MDTTSASLLLSLRQSGGPAAWSRFVRTYSPMVYSWACRIGLQDADALDLVQDVFTTLVQKLPEFHYDGDRGFREWLWVVTKNKYLERARRRRLPIDAGASPDHVAGRPGRSVEDEDFRRHLIGRLVPAYERQFQPSTWRAFWSVVVEGKSPTAVASELGLSLDAVYKAKARVLARLHGELADLVDD